MNNDNFTVLIIGGLYMLLSEHVYSVAIAFKMTEWAEQQICTKFCVKLEHSSMETIWMIQRAAAMGNWWLAALSQWPTCSCITSCSVFWRNKSPRWLSLPTDQIWCPATYGFSQNWNHLWKGRDFRPSMKFRKIWQAAGILQLGEPCEVPRCLLWKELRHHCPMCNVSCILDLHQ